jgi:hypothetical protein
VSTIEEAARITRRDRAANPTGEELSAAPETTTEVRKLG